MGLNTQRCTRNKWIKLLQRLVMKPKGDAFQHNAFSKTTWQDNNNQLRVKSIRIARSTINRCSSEDITLHGSPPTYRCTHGYLCTHTDTLGLRWFSDLLAHMPRVWLSSLPTACTHKPHTHATLKAGLVAHTNPYTRRQALHTLTLLSSGLKCQNEYRQAGHTCACAGRWCA